MIEHFFMFFLVGLIAQLIDGSLGMAYGVVSMTALLSMGISPVYASASVHIAETVTAAISGFFHAIFKNIDYRLFFTIIMPGVLGSILGAYLLTQVSTPYIKQTIIFYLFIMGLIILHKAFKKKKINGLFKMETKSPRLPSSHVRGYSVVAVFGGFFDAAGGGGWGPIVTSSLLAQGATPHYTVGTISLAEFLVSLAASVTFLSVIGIPDWTIIAGLILGGAVGAPLAAYLVRRIESKILMVTTGLLIICMCALKLIAIFFL